MRTPSLLLAVCSCTQFESCAAHDTCTGTHGHQTSRGPSISSRGRCQWAVPQLLHLPAAAPLPPPPPHTRPRLQSALDLAPSTAQHHIICSQKHASVQRSTALSLLAIADCHAPHKPQPVGHAKLFAAYIRTGPVYAEHVQPLSMSLDAVKLLQPSMRNAHLAESKFARPPPPCRHVSPLPRPLHPGP